MKTNFKAHTEAINSIIKQNKDSMLLDICSYLKDNIYHYDWVGFYILRDGKLELGSYVGKATQHTSIALGKGICGQVAERMESMAVQDVSKVENYISCGLEVQSEIVVPIIRNAKFIAEIDIDSHAAAPFTDEDLEFLEHIASLIPEQLFQ